MSTRHPVWLGLAAMAGAGFLQLLGRTWRIEDHGLEAGDAALERGERCIFAFWHARMLPLVFTHRGRGVAILISQHRDGELIARMIHRLGYVTARGSSTRGGEEGTREMLRLAEAGHLLGITPDGPRGPAGQVKPGLVYLASRTGFPILPITAASSHTLVFRSWDRFRMPWPFARVVVAYGEPILVPPDLEEAEMEGWCKRIESALCALTRVVAARAGERP